LKEDYSKKDITKLQREIDKKLRKARSKLVGKGFILAQAEPLVKEAMEICEIIDDKNRQAIATMTIGRIRYAQGQFSEALDSHKQAIYVWERECTKSERNQQLYEENFVFILKAMVAKGIRFEYRTTTALECAKVAKLRLRLRSDFINFGKTCNSIDTIFQNIILFFLN
jgi:hypothetical protein